MSTNDNLLERATAAGTRLADAEREALLAKADYHAAIRRLHLAGTSLREIAQALSLSHQRVQQVVSAAGGSWWRLWRRRSIAGEIVCTWCERPPSEVAKMIAGPKIYLCDACVEASDRKMREGEAATGGTRRCDFCGKRASAERALLAGRANVCSDCLRICREIIDSRVA